MEAPANQESQTHWRIKAWFPELDNKTHDLLKIFFQELLKQNKTFNLIPSKTIVHCDALHFADSILASKIVYKNANNNNQLYDIGSGNGFPGLVYGILFPEQEVVLVEVEDRKCEFLTQTIKLLGVTNVEVANKKIEAHPANSISQAICRNYSTLPKTLLTLRKIIKTGGVVFHLKSSEWSLEVSQIPIQLCSSWQPVMLGEYKLPIGENNMFLVKTDKIN